MNFLRVIFYVFLFYAVIIFIEYILFIHIYDLILKTTKIKKHEKHGKTWKKHEKTWKKHGFLLYLNIEIFYIFIYYIHEQKI
jgi:purine-cytosine permease-like protein